jgi:cytochrome oxidase Cu insertion factor (SCO1/SenC/PrrC family)
MTRLLFLVPVAWIVGCGLFPAPSTPTPTDPPPLDLDFPVGPFSLTERSGKTITEKDLLGKVWIASFIFTRCNGPCPAVTNTMARLQRELHNELATGQLKLVTFTVDPRRDDLTALNIYAKNRQADPNYWLFLTGDEQTIHQLVREQFKQTVIVETGPDVKEGFEFDHSTRLSLVDKNGIIRATYEGLPNENRPDGHERFEKGLKHLQERVRELLK